MRSTTNEIGSFATRALSSLGTVLYGKDEVLERVLACLLAGGHLLLQDVPGTGKTLLGKGLARILGVGFRRIQCTPDLLPGDVTGSNVFNQKTQEFEFHMGPVFTNILLADEINRATPRAQAALLECMAECQVSVEGTTRELDAPFFVIATQNPVDHEGTFALPEAQLDRFLMRLTIGYPGAETERAMLLAPGHEALAELQPVVDGEELDQLQRRVGKVRVADEVIDFVVALVAETRESPELLLGGGPRASLALYRASQALAAIRGRDFVLPDDAKELFGPVLGHRVILSADARIQRLSVDDALEAVLGRVSAPLVKLEEKSRATRHSDETSTESTSGT